MSFYRLGVLNPFQWRSLTTHQNPKNRQGARFYGAASDELKNATPEQSWFKDKRFEYFLEDTMCYASDIRQAFRAEERMKRSVKEIDTLISHHHGFREKFIQAAAALSLPSGTSAEVPLVLKNSQESPEKKGQKTSGHLFLSIREPLFKEPYDGNLPGPDRPPCYILEYRSTRPYETVSRIQLPIAFDGETLRFPTNSSWEALQERCRLLPSLTQPQSEAYLEVYLNLTSGFDGAKQLGDIAMCTPVHTMTTIKESAELFQEFSDFLQTR